MKNYKVRDIELELSTLCHAECPLCYRNYKSYDKHYPEDLVRPLDEIIAQLNSYPDLEWIRLVGSISEPIMYPYFLDLVYYIKNRNIKIEICTNGSLRNQQFWNNLRNLLTKDDKVYFTICGSTQELHETYRKNTSLKRILENARAFRGSNKNDYAQCIRFDYNDEDFNSKKFKDMVSEFSNVYWTETFLLKDELNYKDTKDIDKLIPFQGKINHYKTIEKISNLKWNESLRGIPKKTWCKAYHENRLQLDIHGNAYPCYLFLEASKGKIWNGDWDDIHNLKYECCKFCEESVVKLCDELDLDYVI